jgi:hypothetical protein
MQFSSQNILYIKAVTVCPANLITVYDTDEHHVSNVKCPLHRLQLLLTANNAHSIYGVLVVLDEKCCTFGQPYLL